MASTLTVDNIVGATSASKVMIPGHVVQVVQSQIATTASTASTSNVASGLQASITPNSASNKILIMLNGGNIWNNSNGANMLMYFYRNGVVVETGPHAIIQNASGINSQKSSWSASYLDSPSTTSSITYEPYYRVNTGTGYFNEQTVRVMLTLMEIAQ